jgi:proteic killer suppression protein
LAPEARAWPIIPGSDSTLQKITQGEIPPGNRLEALKGKRRGQWSIRINDQWRVCFRFKDGDAFDVEIPAFSLHLPGALRRVN